MQRYFTYILIGLAGGLIGGLMGVGGGIIMIPLLTWYGLGQKRAQGTSLTATVPLALVGAIIYSREPNFDYHAAIPLAIGGVVGAYIGAGVVRRFSNRILFKLFGLLLILLAARHAFSAFIEPSIEFDTHMVSPLFAGLTGVFAGFVSGFFGVGGGVVFVPAGVQLLSLAEKAAHGASLTAIIPTALVGVFRYRSAGEIETPACIPLIIGAVAGSLVSSLMALEISDKYLAIVFAAFLALVGLRRLFRNNPYQK
jgi:uncharacterized membrane protein YfcA